MWNWAAQIRNSTCWWGVPFSRSTASALRQSVEAGNMHPLQVKKDLARRLVADFHSPAAASQAQKDFEAQFRDKALPEVLPTQQIELSEPRKLFRLLTELGLAESNAEAQRKIKEGAVHLADLNSSGELCWQRITDPVWTFDPREHGEEVAFRVGSKRLLKLVLSSPRD